jgi:hypothetical protein
MIFPLLTRAPHGPACVGGEDRALRAVEQDAVIEFCVDLRGSPQGTSTDARTSKIARNRSPSNNAWVLDPVNEST